MNIPDILYALTLSANIHFGGNLPPEWSLDVTPTFKADVDFPKGGATGMSLPYLMLLDEDSFDSLAGRATTRGGEPYTRDNMLDHEYEHIRQWQALGPWMAAAYAATGGQPFEDYAHNGTTWLPAEGSQPNFPMFRLRGGGGEPAKFSAFPGWDLGLGGGE